MYSKELADAMKSYLDSKNCNYDFDEEDGGFIFRTCDDGKIQKLLFVIQVKQHSYNICVILEDFEITEANIDVISEYTHRCNDVCCQCHTNCEGIIPTKEIIEESIFGADMLVHTYGDIICDVAEGKEIDQEAFHRLLMEDKERKC